jgi:hypothetical protein
MYAFTTRRFGWVALLALAAGSAQAQTPGALRVELQAAGHFDRSHAWSIDKRVTPASADRFIGEIQQLGYTLTLARGEARDSGFRVTGSAVIANDTAADTTVTAITLTYGGTPVTQDCATGPLAAGASRTCALDFAAPDAQPRTLAIDVDTSGGANGAQASAAVPFGEPVVTGESITVRDTRLAAPLTFTESGTHRYTVDATCVDGNTVVVENTATIVETGASDSTTARVACHATRMERSVASFGDTDWRWSLAKTHATAMPLQAAAGQTYHVDYTITATATGTTTGTVHGAITAINTHPSVDAVILSVAAKINGIDAVVTCPQPMISPHATYDANSNIVVGRLSCPFTVTLAPGQVPSTVTGRVEQQLFDYDSTGNATAAGTRVLQGTQPVPALPAGDTRDECIALADVYLGQTHDLGEACISAGNTPVTRHFDGAITVAATDECQFAVPNLARLTTADSGTRIEATASVTVERTDCVAAAPAGTLELDITGNGTFTRRYPWTLDKTVTPAASDRFVGETQELGYTLVLAKGPAQDAGFRVTGTANIVNPTAGAADITAIDITYGGAPVVHSCATGPLPAGGTRTCALDFTTTSADPRTLRLRVTTNGEAAGGEASAAVAFGTPVASGDGITVHDTPLPDDVAFSQSGTHAYTHGATCQDGNAVVVGNTATIVETGVSDSASARVACHAIRIETSLAGPGSQSYTWKIAKTHGLSGPLRLNGGETHDVAYAITATATPVAAAGAGTLHGTVTVINPHPSSDAALVSVQATVNTTPATVSCPAPMLARSGATLVCQFTVTLPAGEAATAVTARVEQQRFDYDDANRASAAGTNVVQATHTVSPTPAGTITDECVRLTDLYLGSPHDLGEFCASAGVLSVTRPFTGRVTVAADAGCEFSIANTARLVATDSGATAEAATSLTVERADCAAAEAPAGVAVAPPGPITIPATSMATLALLALLFGLVGAVVLPRRDG